MKWNKTPHHHFIFQFFYFVKERFLISLAMMYMFIYCIYTRHINAFIEVWTQDLMEAYHNLNPKPRQDIDSKEIFLTLLCFAWNCLVNSNFNIHFLIQNLFEFYKWKHDLEPYSIMCSKKLLYFKILNIKCKTTLKISCHE